MSMDSAQIGLTAEWIGTEAGGLEAYSRSLVTALGKAGTRHRFTAYTARETALQGTSGIDAQYLGTRWRALYHGAYLPLRLLKAPPDLLHVTSIPPLYSPVPYVMTLHDMGHKVMPEMYPPRIRWRLDRTISMGIRRAKRIICVSEATRQDLFRYHPDVHPDRVDVVAEGGLLNVAEPDAGAGSIRARHGLGDAPYFLYVGRLHVRKNLLTLIDAYALLPEPLRARHPLVLVGRRMYGGDELTQRIARHGLQDRVILTGHVADADLPAIYRGALAFTYPSLFEGFGLPPLEAMSLGVPVICSDRHSLPEVVGDAGLCVDTTQPGSLNCEMKRLALDASLRLDLIARGKERAAMFTWARAASETVKVYEKALAELRPARRAAGRQIADVT